MTKIAHNVFRRMLTTKPDIERWLRKNNIKKFEIKPDLTVDLLSSVIIQTPCDYFPVNFNKCLGDFKAPFLKLQGLDGSPRIVKGDCDFGDNKLTSLKGSPLKVYGMFNVTKNLLKSLENSPKQINDVFFALENPLETIMDLSTNKTLKEKTKMNFLFVDATPNILVPALSATDIQIVVSETVSDCYVLKWVDCIKIHNYQKLLKEQSLLQKKVSVITNAVPSDNSFTPLSSNTKTRGPSKI